MNNYLHAKLRTLSILSTLFVVFVHSHNLLMIMSAEEVVHSGSLVAFIENFISQGITRVASPLFFFISGYLFFLNMKESRGWFLAKVKKRVRTLLIPYLFWSIWGIFFFILLQNLPFVRTFFNSAPITGYSLPELLNTVFINPVPYQLWFVRDLMMLILVSPVVYYTVKHLRLIAVSLMLVAWFTQIDFVIFDNRSLFFFAVGLYLARNPQWVTDKKFPGQAWLFLFLWIALSLMKSYMVFDGVSEQIYGVVHKCSVLCGMFGLWSGYDKLFMNYDLTGYKIYPYFSFSFFIYTSHEPLLTIAKKSLYSILGSSEPAILLNYFAAPTLTILFCVTVGVLLKSKIPVVYSFISGGR